MIRKLKNIWKNATRDPRDNFTSGSSELSKETRRLNSEIKTLEKQREVLELKERVEAMKEDLFGEDEEEEPNRSQDPLDIIAMEIFKNKIMPNMGNQQHVTIEPVQELNLTEEEIDQILSNLDKKIIKQAKKMSPELLSKIIIGHYPNLSPSSLSLVMEKIRTA